MIYWINSGFKCRVFDRGAHFFDRRPVLCNNNCYIFLINKYVYIYIYILCTFVSQNLQNTPFSDHFWKLKCRKNARRYSTKHISKSKCTKYHMFAPLLEVQISKKMHAVVVRSTFRSQNMQNTRGFGPFLEVQITLRFASDHYTTLYTPLQYITLHYTPQQYNYNYRTTQLHSTTLNYNTLHHITLHSTTLHYITLHYTLHYTTLHYTTLYTPHTTAYYTTLHSTILQLQLRNYTTTLHYTPLHSTTHRYNKLHYTTLHYTRKIDR